MTKAIKARLNKTCLSCGKSLKIVLYSKKDYIGGHYLGRIPNYTNKAWKEALKHGTKPWNTSKSIVQVLNVDPIAKSYNEYWECPKCYWKG